MAASDDSLLRKKVQNFQHEDRSLEKPNVELESRPTKGVGFVIIRQQPIKQLDGWGPREHRAVDFRNWREMEEETPFTVVTHPWQDEKDTDTLEIQWRDMIETERKRNTELCETIASLSQENSKWKSKLRELGEIVFRLEKAKEDLERRLHFALLHKEKPVHVHMTMGMGNSELGTMRTAKTERREQPAAAFVSDGKAQYHVTEKRAKDEHDFSKFLKATNIMGKLLTKIF